MAYVTQYYSDFSNELNHRCEIYLQLKDGEEIEPLIFVTKELSVNIDSEEGTILAHEAVLTIWADDNTPITWETFLPNTYDAWKILIKIGDTLQTLFEGFLTPEEGKSPFLDKPYETELRATNGLKLLKSVALTKLDGTRFKGKFTALEYIVAALSKNLLSGIPIRIYCSIYEVSMTNRNEDFTADWFSQAKLDHRTFMTDANTFVNCYDALLILLKRHCRLFYWNGRIVIFYLPEHQFRPAGLYYTEYDSEGNSIGGELETEGHGKFGRNELIYAHNEDAAISARFGIKYARSEFMYIPWPEIPLNNKFERGTVFETGNAPDEDDMDNDGDITEIIGTYKKYTIDDWEWGSIENADVTPPLPALDPGEGAPYVRRVYDIYGVELKRELHLPNALSENKANWLRSEGIPVGQGDKVKISYQQKYDADFTGSSSVGATSTIVYIVADNNSGVWQLQGQIPVNTDQGEWEFDANGSGEGIEGISIIYQEDQDSTKYVSVTVESFAIPVSGTLYIVFNAIHRFDDSTKMIISDFQFEYKPFVAGGYTQVKGDFWKHEQDANMIDNDTDEMQISDCRYKAIKGTLWRNDGVNVTTPTWYRLGVGESRHFKELVNIFRFNLAYRRYYKIEGSFIGLFYEPVNDQTNKQLISFHKEYSCENLNPKRRFILVPPLQMNIGTGEITAEFQEVLNPDDFVTALETVQQVMARLIQAFNATDEEEWNSESAAPAPGTISFPPVAGVYPYEDRSILLQINEDDEATATADANGAGNSPSITEIYNEIVGPGFRWQIFQLGTDIAEGNKFTLTLYGHEITVTVQEVTTFADGSQLGDSQEFNYIF